MQADAYPLQALTTSEFQFYSEGPRGRILKIIRFTLADTELNLYNLGFGDYDPITGQVNDRVKSDNQDVEKVLITVAQAAFLFSETHPDALLYAEGSTPVRTRFYQINLNKHWRSVSTHFQIWGLLGEEWEPFSAGKNYEAFLAKSK